MLRRAVVVSASSDIGAALCRRWAARGTALSGTYRRRSAETNALKRLGVALTPCDLSSKSSVNRAAAKLKAAGPWDALVLGAGELSPIGPFESIDFDAWEKSFTVNFTAQLRIVRALLPSRRRGGPAPSVLFFAGGGANGAPRNYSAYTASKIALTKMVELLDAEVPGVRFVIVGPGWVKTKIHDATLKAGKRAGDARARTLERLKSGEFTPMERVLDCCDWAVSAPREQVGGRNFSAAHDEWGSEQLARKLSKDPALCKLRRSGNEEAAPAR